jgi:hypothetical protein
MNDPRCHRFEASTSRRDFLFNAGLGLGAMAYRRQACLRRGDRRPRPRHAAAAAGSA